MTLELGKLFTVVDALHFHRIVGLGGRDHQSIADSHLDHIRQVILTLNIVVGEAAQPVGQSLPRYRENPGVPFLDRLLRFSRIFVLDNSADAMLRVTNDPTVAGWVIQRDGQQASC